MAAKNKRKGKKMKARAAGLNHQCRQELKLIYLQLLQEARPAKREDEAA